MENVKTIWSKKGKVFENQYELGPASIKHFSGSKMSR